jgi:hypothetical protein
VKNEKHKMLQREKMFLRYPAQMAIISTENFRREYGERINRLNVSNIKGLEVGIQG